MKPLFLSLPRFLRGLLLFTTLLAWLSAGVARGQVIEMATQPLAGDGGNVTNISRQPRVIHLEANSKGTPDGSVEHPYTDFIVALDAAKALSPSESSPVTVKLGVGSFPMTNSYVLDTEYLSLEGVGDSTRITQTSIARSAANQPVRKLMFVLESGSAFGETALLTNSPLLDVTLYVENYDKPINDIASSGGRIRIVSDLSETNPAAVHQLRGEILGNGNRIEYVLADAHWEAGVVRGDGNILIHAPYVQYQITSDLVGDSEAQWSGNANTVVFGDFSWFPKLNCRITGNANRFTWTGAGVLPDESEGMIGPVLGSGNDFISTGTTSNRPLLKLIDFDGTNMVGSLNHIRCKYAKSILEGLDDTFFVFGGTNNTIEIETLGSEALTNSTGSQLGAGAGNLISGNGHTLYATSPSIFPAGLTITGGTVDVSQASTVIGTGGRLSTEYKTGTTTAGGTVTFYCSAFGSITNALMTATNDASRTLSLVQIVTNEVTYKVWTLGAVPAACGVCAVGGPITFIEGL